MRVIYSIENNGIVIRFRAHKSIVRSLTLDELLKYLMFLIIKQSLLNVQAQYVAQM